MATALEALTTHQLADKAPFELSRRDYVRQLRRMTTWLIALGLCARLFRYLLSGSIWNDEAAVALNIIRRDFEGLTHALDEMQVAPIFFLWAERAVLLVLGSSEHAMRFVPCLFGLGGLIVFWDFARRVVPPPAAAFAIGIMAVARWPVMMSSTIKPYTADMFCSTLLMALAVRWRQQPDRLWPLVALAAVVPFTLGMSYPTVFVAGSVSVYLLPAVWRCPDRRVTALFAGYNVMMLAAFAVVFSLVLRQGADPQAAALKEFMRTYWKHGFPPGGVPDFIWWSVKIHTGRLMSYPWGDGNGGSTLTCLLFLTGVWSCVRSDNRYILLLCLTPFALNFVAAALGQYPYGACTRLSMHLAPSICLLIGCGISRILETVSSLERRLRWTRGVFVVLGLFGIAEMVADAVKPHREFYGRWMQRMTLDLERQLEPGDEIAFRCPIPKQRETLDWYMARFGERVSWHGPTVTHPDTLRVWLIVITVQEPAEQIETKFRSTLGQEWVSVSRTEHQIQANEAERWTIKCVVHCLARRSQ
ncbi:MAG: hypothetical protein C0467_00770 [Planctomycetaceae bacterium]|nr:hypothetical protein [Planctomycetaceae bacterium]